METKYQIVSYLLARLTKARELKLTCEAGTSNHQYWAGAYEELRKALFEITGTFYDQ